ncbi:hypothetical protein [Limobrevibacterium gyesilva]|uniref:hypothetical protein n=1 Tax=Limobrevibacterium gyesilva TaxID=2991712 RepID=UPI0022276F2F|nr:hypothetical protein [Limobrevibacterium gyesilva]
MLIRLITNPTDEYRWGANEVRQRVKTREHFRRGNAPMLTKTPKIGAGASAGGGD